MSSQSNPVSREEVESSIQSAVSQSQISAATGKTVLEQLDQVAIDGAGGVDIEEVDSEEVTLVVTVIDTSYSMNSFRKAVIDSYNEQFLKPLRAASNAASLFVSTWLFNSNFQNSCRLLHGYTPVRDCSNLTKAEYEPNGGTPLNDAVYNAFTGLIRYGQVLRDGGTRTKCIVLVLSDGEENSSSRTAVSIKRIAEDLLRQEYYILSYIFFGDQSIATREAKKIGFPPQHQVTSNQTDADIRRIFGTVSSSVISTSQNQVSAQALSANKFITTP